MADEEHGLIAEQKANVRWNLRRNGWPDSPRPEEVREARHWIRDKFDDICASTGFVAVPKHKRKSEQSVEISTLRPIRPEPPNGADSDKPPEHDMTAHHLFCPLVPAVLRGAGFDQKAQRRLLPFFGTESLSRGGPMARGFSPGSEDAIVEQFDRSMIGVPRSPFSQS